MNIKKTKNIFQSRKKELENIITQSASNLSYAHKKDYIETWKLNMNETCFSYSSFNHAKQNTMRAWIRGKIIRTNENYIELDTFSPDKNNEIFNLITDIVQKTNTQHVKVTTNHINSEYKRILEKIPYKK